MRTEIPAGTLELLTVPGLRPDKALKLYKELGISSVEDLEQAAKQERLKNVKGLGSALQRKILQGIEIKRRSEGQRHLHRAAALLELAQAQLMRSRPGVSRITPAGAFRRGCELIGDLSLVAQVSDVHGAVYKQEDQSQLALHLTDKQHYGAVLLLATGSQEHLNELREIAAARGMTLDKDGLRKGDKIIASESEEEIYCALGLQFIEPELREGRGELKAAREGALPDLISVDDIRGDLHSHTTLSDGRNSLEEMAAAARERGYAYLAITDHSASHGFGDHVTAERLWERVEEVREWNEGKRGFRLLAGSEINIGLDGALDYPDDLVEALDWVVASVHTSFSVGDEAMTERVLAAIENPNVDCIGHLTGRLIGRREPYGIDVEAVAEAAARTGKMLEINGNPNRRDLSEHHARLAREAGATIVLNTDAHGVDTLGNMAYAVATARRAWLGPDDIANTRGWAAFKKLLK